MIYLCEFAPKHLSDLRDLADISETEAEALSTILDHLTDHLRDYRFKHLALRDGRAVPVDPMPLKGQLGALENWFRRAMPGKHVELGFEEREIARFLNDSDVTMAERIQKIQDALFEVEDKVVQLDLKLAFVRAVLGHLTCSTRDLSDLALAGVLYAVVQDSKSLELLLRMPPHKDPIQDRVS